MSIRVSSIVWQYSTARQSNLLLLLAISDYADDAGRNAFPSVATLAAKARISDRQVRIGLRELEAAGEIETSIGTGPHGCNEYHVLLADRYALQPVTGAGRRSKQGATPLNNVPPEQCSPLNIVPSTPEQCSPNPSTETPIEPSVKRHCVDVPPTAPRTDAPDDLSVSKSVSETARNCPPSPKVKGKPNAKAPDDAEWLAGLRTDPAYAGLNIDREMAKCQRWCNEKRLSCTRTRIINWLNRADVPMPAAPEQTPRFSDPSPRFVPPRTNAEHFPPAERRNATLADLTDRNAARRAERNGATFLSETPTATGVIL